MSDMDTILTCSGRFLGYLQWGLFSDENANIKCCCTRVICARGNSIELDYIGDVGARGAWIRSGYTGGAFAKESCARNCFFSQCAYIENASIGDTFTVDNDTDIASIKGIDIRSNFAKGTCIRGAYIDKSFTGSICTKCASTEDIKTRDTRIRDAGIVNACHWNLFVIDVYTKDACFVRGIYTWGICFDYACN